MYRNLRKSHFSFEFFIIIEQIVFLIKNCFFYRTLFILLRCFVDWLSKRLKMSKINWKKHFFSFVQICSKKQYDLCFLPSFVNSCNYKNKISYRFTSTVIFYQYTYQSFVILSSLLETAAVNKKKAKYKC